MCARVLKSIYYPRGNLLDTVFSSDASPSWRGIEFGLELLKEGVIWRVGNGKSIQIQKDHWLPRSEGQKTASFIRRTRIRWVNQLLLPTERQWNVDLIKQIFYQFDAEEICKLRLPSAETADSIAWHYEKSGQFTVKSAYKLADMIKRNSTSGASASNSEAGVRNLWDMIWKAKVPEKIKIFGWRTATNSLATKLNTCRRTITTDSICSLCGKEDENEFHAVNVCTRSKALRFTMRPIWNLPKEDKFRYTGTDWLQILLNSQDEITRRRILMLFWQCWNLRNDAIHGVGKGTVQGSAILLTRYEEEFANAQIPEKQDRMSSYSLRQSGPGTLSVATTARWMTPEEGWVKLNTDASFIQASGGSWGGAVARDAQGRVRLSACLELGKCNSPVEAEVAAVLGGCESWLKFSTEN